MRAVLCLPCHPLSPHLMTAFCLLLNSYLDCCTYHTVIYFKKMASASSSVRLHVDGRNDFLFLFKAHNGYFQKQSLFNESMNQQNTNHVHFHEFPPWHPIPHPIRLYFTKPSNRTRFHHPQEATQDYSDTSENDNTEQASNA